MELLKIDAVMLVTEDGASKFVNGLFIRTLKVCRRKFPGHVNIKFKQENVVFIFSHFAYLIV